jgi:hypothetical protein
MLNLLRNMLTSYLVDFFFVMNESLQKKEHQKNKN